MNMSLARDTVIMWLKKKGVEFGKPCPTNVELCIHLFASGVLSKPPTKSKAGNMVKGVARCLLDERGLNKDSLGKATRQVTSNQAPAKTGFFWSREWRTLRYKVLKHYGRRCMCCGATPEDGAAIHVDHIKPRKFYPELELDASNLQVLCEECNFGKGAWDETDWRTEGKYPEDVMSHMQDILH